MYLDKQHQHVFVTIVSCRHGQEQAAAMYSKLPQLLLYRTPNLRRKTAALAAVLGLNPSQANQLVRSDPRLLTYSPDLLQQRGEALQELLQLRGQKGLRKVVMAWPSLLRKSTQSIAGEARSAVVTCLKVWIIWKLGGLQL
jgi:hypothetical protein